MSHDLSRSAENAPDLIPLTQLSHELKSHTGRAAPRYRYLYRLVLDGHIVTRRVGRFHMVERSSLSAIAEIVARSSVADHRAAA